MVPPPSAFTVGLVSASTVARPTDTSPTPRASEPAVVASLPLAVTRTLTAPAVAPSPSMLPSAAASVLAVILAVGVLVPKLTAPTETLLVQALATLLVTAVTSMLPAAADTLAPDSIAARVVDAIVESTVRKPSVIAPSPDENMVPTEVAFESASTARLPVLMVMCAPVLTSAAVVRVRLISVVATLTVIAPAAFTLETGFASLVSFALTSSRRALTLVAPVR